MRKNDSLRINRVVGDASIVTPMSFLERFACEALHELHHIEVPRAEVDTFASLLDGIDTRCHAALFVGPSLSHFKFARYRRQKSDFKWSRSVFESFSTFESDSTLLRPHRAIESDKLRELETRNCVLI